MNRRQMFALATTPALGVPTLPIETKSDWRVDWLKFKLKLYREIIDPVYRRAEEIRAKINPGSTEYLWSLIRTSDKLLARTDAQAEADKIRTLTMINEGRVSRGKPPITEFDC